jgi:hypothetical protein
MPKALVCVPCRAWGAVAHGWRAPGAPAAACCRFPARAGGGQCTRTSRAASLAGHPARCVPCAYSKQYPPARPCATCVWECGVDAGSRARQCAPTCPSSADMPQLSRLPAVQRKTAKA